MKRKSIQITLPGYVNDFLVELMAEMGTNKSELIEECIMYVSMPEHLDDFKSQFVLGDAGEDEGEDEDEEEEEDETEDEGEDEDEEDKPGLLERIFGSKDEEEEE